ncbi:LacI family DNA-binding transcriptional regulator [Hansschlegelia sp. KR7-227]|uniref:LacI family DNA-binding transcriptional regulator n=1 Tax=Hansschlegelia sp. KR7-227 TaxID=3400914 RepID=UPI003C038166
MADVAKLAGVSAMTVSRALRQDGSVSDRTRARVLEVIDEVGYVPDQAAGALSSGRSGLVAVIMPTFTVPPFAQIARGLHDTLSAEGLELFMSFSDYSPEREEQVLRAVLRRRPEALAIVGVDHTDRATKLLEAAGIPVIECLERAGQGVDHVVAIDQAAAGQAAVRHLASRGRRRVAVAASRQDPDAGEADRIAGVTTAARELGLDQPIVIRHGSPLAPLDQGLRAAGEALDRHPDVDALVCMNDYAAVGVVGELRRRGRSAPADLAVVGFGDSDISRHVEPAITTIGFNPVLVGVEMGKMVLSTRAAARLGRTLPSYRLNIDFQLIVRESA